MTPIGGEIEPRTPAAARWMAHVRKHGPADEELQLVMLALASRADAAGHTGIGRRSMLLAPCRECGLGLLA
jgi:hypothetical protein